jgi:hypothetical protein
MPARTHRSLLLLTAAALLLGSIAVAGAAVEPAEQFGDAWTRYEQRSGYKALAVASDDALGVWAIASGVSSEVLAVQGALESCRARALRERVGAECRVVAIGDRLLDETPSTQRR